MILARLSFIPAVTLSRGGRATPFSPSVGGRVRNPPTEPPRTGHHPRTTQLVRYDAGIPWSKPWAGTRSTPPGAAPLPPPEEKHVNKTQLATAIATSTGKPKADVTEIVNAVFNTIQDTVAAGEDITIPGFGKFERVYRPARTAKNPSTGEDIDVAESHAPKFRPGAGFKDVVNCGKALAAA